MGDPGVVAALGQRRHAGTFDVLRAHAGDLEQTDVDPGRQHRVDARPQVGHPELRRLRECRTRRRAVAEPRRRTRPTRRRPRSATSWPCSRRHPVVLPPVAAVAKLLEKPTELSTEPQSYTLQPSTDAIDDIGERRLDAVGQVDGQRVRLRVTDDHHRRRAWPARSWCSERLPSTRARRSPVTLHLRAEIGRDRQEHRTGTVGRAGGERPSWWQVGRGGRRRIGRRLARARTSRRLPVETIERRDADVEHDEAADQHRPTDRAVRSSSTDARATTPEHAGADGRLDESVAHLAHRDRDRHRQHERADLRPGTRR